MKKELPIWTRMNGNAKITIWTDNVEELASALGGAAPCDDIDGAAPVPRPHDVIDIPDDGFYDCHPCTGEGHHCTSKSPATAHDATRPDDGLYDCLPYTAEGHRCTSESDPATGAAPGCQVEILSIFGDFCGESEEPILAREEYERINEAFRSVQESSLIDPERLTVYARMYMKDVCMFEVLWRHPGFYFDVLCQPVPVKLLNVNVNVDPEDERCLPWLSMENGAINPYFMGACTPNDTFLGRVRQRHREKIPHLQAGLESSVKRGKIAEVIAEGVPGPTQVSSRDLHEAAIYVFCMLSINQNMYTCIKDIFDMDAAHVNICRPYVNLCPRKRFCCLDLYSREIVHKPGRRKGIEYFIWLCDQPEFAQHMRHESPDDPTRLDVYDVLLQQNLDSGRFLIKYY